MAGSESNKRSNLWPMLLVLVVVIGLGFLYLASVSYMEPEQGPEEGTAQFSETVPELTPAQQQAEPPASAGERTTAAGEAATGRAGALSSVPAHAEPAQAPAPAQADPVAAPLAVEPAPAAPLAPVAPSESAESAVVDRGRPQVQDAPPAPPQMPPRAAAGSDQAAVREPDRIVTGKPQLSGDASVSDMDAETTGQPSAPPVAPRVPAQPPAASVSAVPASPVPSPAMASGPVAEGVGERRARIVAEYQAMQRRYWKQARQRWERAAGPWVRETGPYGAYPGYSPGYYGPRQ
jgi:hypothetical protein